MSGAGRWIRHARGAVGVLLLAAGVAACAKAVWMLVLLLRFEMHPVHHGWDGLIYTALGRGILNGLVPYKDLFETKPPGMFLISALSLRLSGDIRVGNLLQGCCEAGIVLLLTLAPVFAARHEPRRVRLLLGIGGFLYGALLVHYLAQRAGHFQTESFGSVFAVAFLALGMAVTRRSVGYWAAAAVLCAACLGMKESFLGVLLAGVLVLHPPRTSWREFLLPIAIALPLGAAVLWMLGYLDPYLHVYLPEMLGGRASEMPLPAWVVAFFGSAVARDLWRFSPFLLLSVVALWGSSLALSAGVLDGGRRRMGALGALLGAFLVFYAAYADVLASAVSRMRSYKDAALVSDPYLLPLIASACAFAACACFGMRRWLGPEAGRRLCLAFAAHAAAVMLVVCSIAAGGMAQQQMGLLIPLCAAAFLSVAYAVARDGSFAARASLLCAAVLAGAGIAFVHPPDYPVLLSERIAAEEQGKTEAHAIDAVLDACGWDRYIVFGQINAPFAYTLHSPYGPGFVRPSYTFPVGWRDPPIPYLREEYERNLRAARFLVARLVPTQNGTAIDATAIPDDVWLQYQTLYTPEVPPCARPFPAPPGMAFRFSRR